MKSKILKKADRKENVRELRAVLNRAMITMTKPTMMHFVCEVQFSELPSKIIQPIKRAFKTAFNDFEKCRLARHVEKGNTTRLRKRHLPMVEIVYSIESKIIEDKIKLVDYKYDHIHFMFIVDFGSKYFGFTEISTILNNALNSLPFVIPISKYSDFEYRGHMGVNACGFLRYRNPHTKNKAHDADFTELRGHDLKTEFEDALIRASYLCKSEQKLLLPSQLLKYSFGHTRPSRAANDEAEYQQAV